MKNGVKQYQEFLRWLLAKQEAVMRDYKEAPTPHSRACYLKLVDGLAAEIGEARQTLRRIRHA